MNLKVDDKTGLVDLTHRICVVDDDEIIRTLMEDILSDDYEVTTFEHGKKLIQYLEKRNTKPDLYVLDLMMPEMNGIETAKHIRALGIQAPIIAMSGNLDDALYKGLFEQGFYEALSKPFSNQVLKTKIENALENALIPNYKGLIDLFSGAIAYMGDARDGLTQYHTLRIGEISSLIAQELGLSKKISDNLRLAVRLHDVGKIKIKDEVLQKPGRLTSEEFEYMKTHTTEGAAILETFAMEQSFELLNVASIIAHLHHEKLDGSGYPLGLEKNEIPDFVKIVTVVDIFDACTMERPYHGARPTEFGFKVLQEERDQGKLDGEVVQAFLKREKEIREIKKIYS